MLASSSWRLSNYSVNRTLARCAGSLKRWVSQGANFETRRNDTNFQKLYGGWK
jgi:hypothetical protein